ncbi:MAG: 50S ribosomal protein L33 [Epsilonproteobacteria bacterium]|nr:50S ribosomal protein L33 [Campylobacterota bacterium]
MRDLFALQCPDCKRKNYMITRNKKLKKEKTNLNKYCPFCKRHTLHKEVKA